ncbi:hypothetical protein [Pseudomonas phage PSA11]|nr:hypothetical protein [Pseudomonas phage PSA11]
MSELNKESVEQAGGDERAAFEAWATHLPMDRQPLRPDLYMPPTQWAWEAWQFRAALAQPSPAPDLAERGTTTEQTCRHDFYGVWWNRNGVTKTGRECRHCGFFVEDATEALAEQAEAERPEVVAWRYDYRGGIVSDKACLDEWKSGGEYQSLMTVAQHECIVGELRAGIAQLRQHKNDYMDSGQETYRALQNEIREREAEIARLDGLVSGRTAERDAALARVADMKTMADNYCALLMDANAKLAEMERQEPVALANRGLHAFWVKWTEEALIAQAEAYQRRQYEELKKKFGE